MHSKPTATARREMEAEIDRLREALDAAGYYIDRLRTAHAGKPVRDLEEAGVAYYRLAGLAKE